MKSYEERFAANLQQMRNRMGMSQRQLAERIGFSDKAVSKWERAGAIPDVAVLYQMAEVFGVGLDDFFREKTVYFLGIDGGGTKTQLTLADEQMNIIRQVRGDCCNPIDIGLDMATKRLKEGILQICDGIPLSDVTVFAGIAGGTSSHYQTALQTFFREFGFYACESDSDNRNIISAGLGHGNGVTLILGTGICAFCQKDGVRKRVAGWGYLFDDGGSAYNIGRDGLTAHFQALDGTGEQTEISRILHAGQPDPQVLLGELYAGGKKEIAGYAHVVYDAARENDPVAISILRRNMGFAAMVIETAAAGLEEDKIPVVLTGGLTAEPLTMAYLQEALGKSSRFDVQILSYAPVHGALILAKELYEKKKQEG